MAALCGYTLNVMAFRNAKQSLAAWLKEHDVPALTDVDTRMLTKLIRERGSLLGKIQFEHDAAVEYYDPNLTNLVAEVSVKSKVVYNKGEIQYKRRYYDMKMVVVH